MRLIANGILAAGLLAAAPALAADLTVTVTGVRSDAGVMRVALFDVPKEFPEGEKRDSIEVAAHNDRVSVTFRNLPPGRYALAIHHDEDGDDAMKTNAVGLPLEGYGFSNDAPVFLGPPGFDKAAFDVPESGTTISLKARY